LAKLEAQTVTAVTDSGRDNVTSEAKQNQPCTLVTSVTAPINSLDAFEERAAIIEHEAGIPRQWAEAFARVCCMQRPESIPPAHWQRIVDATGRMLDSPQHIQDMVRYGWSVADIFGVHPAAPINRQDAKGLLLLLREHEAIAIVDANTIGLRNTRTGNLLFYRHPLNPTRERIMLWELQ